MAAWLGPRNAVAYAWFQARGGLLVHGLISGGAVVAGAGLMAMMSYNGGDAVFSGWAVVMLALMGGLGLLVGALGVTNAIRADAGGVGGGGMHDSLRLMRASPGAVVMGYVTGASSQAWCVIVPCVVLGVAASVLGGVGPGGAVRWLWGAMLLLATVGMGLVVAALLGMLLRQAAVLMVVGVVVSPMAMGLLLLVPGLALLAGPVTGAGVFDPRSAEIQPGLVLSVLAQGGVAAVFFMAAARKYRAPEGMAFNVDLGLALLGIWSAASVLGLLAWEVIQPRWLRSAVEMELHLGSGVVVPGVVVALVALLSAGRRAGRGIASRRVFGVSPADALGAGSLVAVVLGVAVVLVLPLGGLWYRMAEVPEDFAARVMATWGSVVLFGTGVVLLGVLGHGRYPMGGKWVAGIGSAALLLVPLIVDLVWLMIEQPTVVERVLGPVGFSSPWGMAIELWTEGAVGWGAVGLGLVLQGVWVGWLAVWTVGGLRRPVAPPPLPA